MTLSYEQIAEILSQTAIQQAENARLIEKNSYTLQELSQNIKDLTISQSEMEKQMKEFFAQSSIQQAKNEKLIEENSLSIKELFARMDARDAITDKKMKEVFSKLGDLGLLQGNIVEENICRSIPRIFKEEGKEFKEIHQNVTPDYHIRKELGNAEYDIVAVNGTEVLVTEVKSQVRKDDIEKFVNKSLPEFTTFFPEYEGYKIFGAIGGALITPHVERYALAQGLYVIIQNGEDLSLVRSAQFVPKVFF